MCVCVCVCVCVYVCVCSRETHLVLPVVSLAVLDDFVAELEEVAHVFVPLVCQVCHGEESLSAVLEGDLEQMEDLWRRRRLGMYAWRE